MTKYTFGTSTRSPSLNSSTSQTISSVNFFSCELVGAFPIFKPIFFAYEAPFAKRFLYCSLSTVSWQTHWAELSTFFKYPNSVRKLIYTTNPIESLNDLMRWVYTVYFMVSRGRKDRTYFSFFSLDKAYNSFVLHYC